MKTITITVPLPGRTLSPNARAHWQTKRASVRRARNTATIMARQALDGRPAPKWERARAEVAFYFADKRRRDPDNMMASIKSAIDGIADAGIVANDSGIWPERPTFHIDRENPRVVITLTEEDTEWRGGVEACSLPHYDEWRKMPPDDAARVIARHRGWSAEMEGLLAALLETFPPQPMTADTGTEGGE